MAKKDLNLSNELSLSMPQQSVDLFDIDNLEQMTFSQLKEKKDMLSAVRQQVMLQVDSIKLQQSIKTLNVMDMILDRMMSLKVDPDGNPCIPAAKDLQAYASALQSLSNVMPKLSRLDTIDGYGTAAEIHIKIENR